MVCALLGAAMCNGTWDNYAKPFPKQRRRWRYTTNSKTLLCMCSVTSAKRDSEQAGSLDETTGAALKAGGYFSRKGTNSEFSNAI